MTGTYLANNGVLFRWKPQELVQVRGVKNSLVYNLLPFDFETVINTYMEMCQLRCVPFQSRAKSSWILSWLAADNEGLSSPSLGLRLTIGGLMIAP
jgi:hypothetical protein